MAFHRLFSRFSYFLLSCVLQMQDLSLANIGSVLIAEAYMYLGEEYLLSTIMISICDRLYGF